MCVVRMGGEIEERRGGMKRVLGNWFHWEIGNRGTHFGFHTRGNSHCFKFKRYEFRCGQLVYWTFWRFFVGFEKDIDDP